VSGAAAVAVAPAVMVGCIDLSPCGGTRRRPAGNDGLLANLQLRVGLDWPEHPPRLV